MTTDDQRDVISFLSTPEAYLLRASLVERIDTHISIVWLAGDRVYKLKRAVRFDYVDFSTIELRRAACEAEVRLNRRTAPSLYLGVRPVTREAGGALALGGEGEPIEWVVEQALLLQQAAPPSTARIAAFEVRLSVNTLRYSRQLHLGRVGPRAIGFHIVAPAEQHDFAEVLRSAVSRHQLAEAVAALAPPLAQYRGLRAMLTTYRSLAADAGLQSLALPTTVAQPGQPQGDLHALYRWLVALGDLPASTPPPGPVYDGVLVEGVKRFQSRHGRHPSGAQD